MAAMISRRLSSRLLKPCHSSSQSLFSTHNLIFNKPQVPIFDPFSQFNPRCPSSTLSTPSNAIAKPSCESLPPRNGARLHFIFYSVSDQKPRNFSFSHSSLSSGISQNAPQSPDLNPHQRLFVRSSCATPIVNSMNPFISWSSVTRPRFFSTNDSSSESEKPQNPNPFPSQCPYFKHQEIEGPTVERDPSSVTNETREVLEGMVKNMCSLSNTIAVLSVLQLGFGGWITYITRSSPITDVSIQSLLAFAFPFSVAFMLRRSLKLKPMHFSEKMGEQGGGGDLSSLANESREVRGWMVKTAKGLTMTVAVSSVVQLGLGAWIAEITWSSPIREVSLQSFLAFAFPFSLLFVLNQSLKPKDSYKKKMAEQGKMLYFAKQLDLFFVRSRGVSFACIAGLSAGLLFAVFSR